MALGGGTFVLQNKTLPGAYINFVSAKNNNVMFGERGYATMPLLLDWGEESKVFEVTNGDFVYVPAEECYEKGGYEVSITPVAKGGGEKIANHLVEMLKELNQNK